MNESSNNKKRSTIVDVIVRMHDSRNLSELDRSLFSLSMQRDVSVHPIIVTQNFSTFEVDAIKSLALHHRWDEGLTPLIVEVRDLRGGDLRSSLLNRGIEATSHRYLGFLDYDDYLHDFAYRYLIDCLDKSQCAISFGDIVVKEVFNYEICSYTLRSRFGVFVGDTLADFMDNNFCPIHSFLIDRGRIEVGDLFFDESLSKLEDYDFLLRLAQKYDFDFSGRHMEIGVYCLKMDGSNTVVVGTDSDEIQRSKIKEWNVARRYVWKTKAETYQCLSKK